MLQKSSMRKSYLRIHWISRLFSRIRFGWETEPTGPGGEAVVASEIDTYGSL